MPTKVPEDNNLSMAQTLDILYVAASIGAACFYPVTRYKMGVRALGWFGAGAFLVILGLAQAWHSEAMSLYFLLWLFAGFVQMFLRDKQAHSRDCGMPIISILPFIKARKTALCMEIVLVWAAGIVVYALFPDDPHAAEFFIVGGLCMGAKEGIEDASRRQEIERMRDAEIEARNRGAAFREWR